MPAPVDICNLALSHLGVSTEIQTLETERSQEAQAARRFYATTRDQVLRDFPWPFASATAALALVEEEPTSEWAYSYRMPAGCLKFRRILSGAGRVETPDTRVPYRILGDDAGALLFTDQADAEGEWTRRVENTEHWPPDAVLAFSLLLASFLAPRVTGGDQFKLGARALQVYAVLIARAQAQAIGEESADRPAESEFVTVRG